VFHVSIWGLELCFGGLSPPSQSHPQETGLSLGLGKVLSNFLWPCTPSAFR